MQNEQETRLVEAAMEGDIDSFGELCQRYYAAVVAIGYSILGDHQLAEDAAQESFARALVNLRNLKSKSKFVPWLAAICRNVARDIAAAKIQNVIAEGHSQIPDGDNRDDCNQMILRAIKQLPDSARELIILRYYNGLSYQQIASMLGISRGAINGRLTRAKRKMSKYLRCNGFPEGLL